MQQLEKVIYVEIKRHWRTMYKLSMNISLMQFIRWWIAHDISFCQLLAGKALSHKHQTCYFLNSQISWSFIRNVFFLEVLLSQEEITPVKTLALCYYMLVRSPCPSTERKTLISEKNKNKSFRCQDWFKRFRYRVLHFHRINIESEYWLSLSLFPQTNFELWRRFLQLFSLWLHLNFLFANLLVQMLMKTMALFPICRRKSTLSSPLSRKWKTKWKSKQTLIFFETMCIIFKERNPCF